MTVHVLALSVELHVPASQSLKAKRSVVTSLVESAKSRFGVAAAETDHQDSWQRAQLGFAAVSGSAAHCTEVIDRVERHVWSTPDVDVLETGRHWLEIDG
jgi:uncharacterized protein YlxP (DUF503 family)